ALPHEPIGVERLLRPDLGALREHPGLGAAERDLDDLVAQEPEGLDPGHGVLADPVLDAPDEGQLHLDLPVDRLREPDGSDPTDGDAGQPDRGPFEQAADLGEPGDEPILALEDPGLAAEEVDEADQHREPGEDEGADAELQERAAGARLGGLHYS